MTKTREQAGLIPTAVLRPHIRQWMDNYTSKQGEPEPDNIIVSATWVLAFRVWKTTGNVEKMRKIVNGKIEHIEFDLADKIICAMGDHTVWYSLGDVFKVSETSTGKGGFEFRDTYWRAKLLKGHNAAHKDRCQRKGCNNVFERHPLSRGQKYCSRKCKQAVVDAKRGKKKSEAGTRQYECKNGHMRTADNQRTRVSRGRTHTSCTDCEKEAYHKRNDYMKEYMRKRRAAAKAAKA